MKTILEHLQSIKYPKLQKFCIDNLDVRYSNTLTYCLSYALMLGVDLSANNTKNNIFCKNTPKKFNKKYLVE